MNKAIVGRAELKLKGAVEAFGYDFRGRTVLDIGSSTGGFTELALRMGAVRVIAIEKGTRQMKAPLRYDRRVELHEKTDFLEVGSSRVGKLLSFSGSVSLSSSKESDPAQPGYNPQKIKALPTPASDLQNSMDSSAPAILDFRDVDTVVADVSFISLREILAHAKKIVPKEADYLVMLKPQFEAFSDQLVNGVVKNEKLRREIMARFEGWLKKNGFRVVKKRDNEVRGKVGGNQERFYWLKRV